MISVKQDLTSRRSGNRLGCQEVIVYIMILRAKILAR